MLTDSYQKIDEGFLSLSGRSVGADGVAKETIAALTGGDAVVTFKAFDDAAKKLIEDRLEQPYTENEEGFLIAADGTGVTVYADSDRAKLYAACSIADKYTGQKMPKGLWWSYPACAHRSLRVFLPPKKDLDYFCELIDQLVHLGYNALLLEIGGAMEFKKHPEVNEGWLRYASSVLETPEKRDLIGKVYYRTKNSVHTNNAGGGVYSQEELRKLAGYCAERFIEIIPEVPSLTHSEYLLVSHPELRECDDEPFASTACPSNPGLNQLVFDLYDEVIDVFHPKAIHIGHDEWWVMCVCEKCRGKDAGKLYADNVLESYRYLKSKGIRTYMWSDKLCVITDKAGEVHGAGRKDVYHVPTRKEIKTVEVMGEEYPLWDTYWFEAPDWVREQGFHQVIEPVDCARLLPADITYVNWYHSVDPAIRETVYHQQGKDMILGNTEPSRLTNYKDRFRYGAQGFSVSCWAETSENNMQNWGATFELGYGSIIAWKHDRTERMYQKNLFEAMDGLYRLRNRAALEGPHIEVTHTVTKNWEDGRKYYGEMSSQNDDALTLGHYRVTYSDGRKEMFPVIFAVNISYQGVSLERCESETVWAYDIDPDYSHVASQCKMRKEPDGVWYTAVLPVHGEAAACEYVPKPGFEDFVAVKDIRMSGPQTSAAD